MALAELQNFLDNASFAVLLVAMLVYWLSSWFSDIPYLRSMGTVGMAIINDLGLLHVI